MGDSVSKKGRKGRKGGDESLGAASALPAGWSRAPSASPGPVAASPGPAASMPSQQRCLYERRGAGAAAGEEADVTDHRVDRVEAFHVPHLAEWVPGLEAFRNRARRTPLGDQCDEDDQGGDGASEEEKAEEARLFIAPGQVVLGDIVRAGPEATEARAFVRAGLRERVVWRADEVVAAVVTCGGLCPGLNNVVLQIAHLLHYRYGVDAIHGVRSGLRGIYDEEACGEWLRLDPAREPLRDCARDGGTVLGSSRGGFDLDRILAALERRGVNQLYIVGGDGTHRAANAIFQEARRRGLKLAVATVPKTVDNDIGTLDRSFGFFTAVEESVRAITSAKVEARCTPNGVGIVKLMGRESGFIAANATLAAGGVVDLCLVPEVPVVLGGPRGVLRYLERVVEKRGHAVVVVAEGAAADLVTPEQGAGATDASGNRLLGDVGALLKREIKAHFKARGLGCSVKYHDPSYMIRSVPANASDSIYCMVLAQNAVHGAFAGYSGFTSAVVNNRPVWMPISLITDTSPAHLNPYGRTWERVGLCTNQPRFRECRRAAADAAAAKDDGASQLESAVPAAAPAAPGP